MALAAHVERLCRMPKAERDFPQADQPKALGVGCLRMAGMVL